MGDQRSLKACLQNSRLSKVTAIRNPTLLFGLGRPIDSEPSTFLLVNKCIIFNKFVKHIQLHMIMIYTGALPGQGPQADINNGPKVTRIVPTFWPQHLFKLNSNNGPFPGHSNLGSDGSSVLLLMDSWWVPYLSKGCRPDFNNGLGCDSNCSSVLAPQRLSEFDSNTKPFQSCVT